MRIFDLHRLTAPSLSGAQIHGHPAPDGVGLLSMVNDVADTQSSHLRDAQETVETQKDCEANRYVSRQSAH